MLFTGSIVNTLSGSMGGVTASRNKGGQYLRARAVPTTSTTVPALLAKATLGSASTHFSTLTLAQRTSWDRYGTLRPEINALGMAKILSGIAAHNRIYTRMVRAGDTPLDAPPIGTDPDALTNVAATFDIGSGTITLTFDPDPLGSTNHLWLEAAVVDSQAINYVENVKRLVDVSAADLASGFDYQTVVEAVFGPLVLGQKVILLPRVYDDSTGLVSLPQRVEGTVIDTP